MTEQVMDQLNHVGGVVLNVLKLALLIAGVLVIILVAGSAPGQPIVFPARDFWMSEMIGVGLYLTDYTIKIQRCRRGLLWLSVHDQKTRRHMAAWSRAYFMAHCGIEFDRDQRGTVIA